MIDSILTLLLVKKILIEGCFTALRNKITEVKPFKDFSLVMDNRGLLKIANLPVSVAYCQEKLYLHSKSS